MKRSYRLIINLLLLASLSACDKKSRQDSIVANPGIDTLFTMKVIGSDKEGWGYEIYKGKKAFIRQSIIPAIGGRKKFISEEEARSIGELVLKKLSKSDGMPAISIEELDSLKISYQ